MDPVRRYKTGTVHMFMMGCTILTFLYDRQDDGSPVSVFEFNANTPAKRNLLPLAKNALRKLRTIRHPDVLKYLDAVETDTTVHVMTERIRPLHTALQDASNKSPQEFEDWVLWGLHRVSVSGAYSGDVVSTDTLLYRLR